MVNFKFIAFTAIAVCLSCNGQHGSIANNNADNAETVDVSVTGNGIYFWKSVFELNGYETDFLRRHDITQLYVKMFDVAPDRDWNTGLTDVFPIATTRFKSSKPDSVNIIPTVYITLDALKRSAGQEESLAGKIVERVLAMVSFNDLGHINTVQFDCDWTESTRDSYFKLCWEARNILEQQDITLSGTVRLHQLKESYYPFEKQVLMLYNLGGLTDYDTRNSILDCTELEKYVNKRMDMEDMDFAYPTFGWGVLFRDKKFAALLHTTDFSDSDRFQVLDVNSYRVIKPMEIEGHSLLPGDVIRLETSDIHEVLKARERVELMLGDHEHHNIIYHLDSLNLSQYSENEIRNIYSL